CTRVVQCVAIARKQGDVRTTARELAGRRPADSGAGAGYHHYFVATHIRRTHVRGPGSAPRTPGGGFRYHRRCPDLEFRRAARECDDSPEDRALRADRRAGARWRLDAAELHPGALLGG